MYHHFHNYHTSSLTLQVFILNITLTSQIISYIFSKQKGAHSNTVYTNQRHFTVMQSLIKKLYIIFRLQNHNCSTERTRIWYQKTTILKNQVTQNVTVCNWVRSSMCYEGNMLLQNARKYTPDTETQARWLGTATLLWQGQTSTESSWLNVYSGGKITVDIFCYQDFRKCMLAMLEGNMAVRVTVQKTNFWIKYYYIFDSNPTYPEKTSAYFPNV